MQRNIGLFTLVCILIGFLSGCAGSQNNNANQIILAYAGTNFQKANGQVNSQSELAGINMAVDEINALGGINGKRILVQTYDDQANKDSAQDVAQKISASQAVVVIGHSTSEASEAAAKVYDESGIPAIDVFPTTQKLALTHLDYYNAAATIETQADYLANYLRKIKREPIVNII